LLRADSRAGCRQAPTRMTPVPVVTKGAGHNRDSLAPHDGETPVQVTGPGRIGVGIRTAGVEAAVDARPRTGQVLGEQVRMAQRVAEEGPASLVQVLAVDEDQHPGGWIGRECRDGRIRHLGSQADGGDKKPRSSNGKPGPVKLNDYSTGRPGSPKHRDGFRRGAGTARETIIPVLRCSGAERSMGKDGSAVTSECSCGPSAGSRSRTVAGSNPIAARSRQGVRRWRSSGSGQGRDGRGG
jgi:hypothetical protein